MSRKKHKNDVVNETNNKVETPPVDEGKGKENEDDVNTTDDKNGFAYKLGAGLGKAVGGVKKVVTSKPARIIGKVALAGGLLAAGYKFGKDGLPDLGSDDDDDFDEDEVDDLDDDETVEETSEE